MSNKAKVGYAPLTFKAGGKTTSLASGKTKDSNQNTTSEINHDAELLHPSSKLPTRTQSPSSPSITPSSSSNILSIVRTGLSQKRSPFQIKNWIACVLTLDGRDKFTKILQYTSRLLGWYFAGLAIKQTSGSGAGGVMGDALSSSAASTTIVTSSYSLLTSLTTNLHLRQKLYTALSQRFNALYKSLVTSRKAFRLGRSVIEFDKLRSMGWGDYLGYMMMHPLAGGVVASDGSSSEDGEEERVILEKREGGWNNRGAILGIAKTLYDTHPIPEEEGSRHEEDGDDDESSWNEESEDEEDDDEDGSPKEEKKLDIPSSKKVKVVSRPGRPKLPSKISSNVGWGPATTSSKVASTDTASTINATIMKQSPSKKKPSADNPPPPSRTVSEMGREMYQSFPSRSSSMGSYKQLKKVESKSLTTTTSTPPLPTTTTTTPAWKLIGGTIKLLGLMGFWTFDNLAFLMGTGFLDPIRLTHSLSPSTTGASSASSENKNLNEYRMKRIKRASEWAIRFYFLGSMGGLYVNVRALWIHRKGLLKDARDGLDEALQLSTNTTSATSTNGNGDNGGGHVVEEAQTHLQQTERQHFELFLALLKSCCDVMVFSNNPGIDLHLKLRGKKNHEGLHCLGGLVSASTVLYSTFPNAK